MDNKVELIKDFYRDMPAGCVKIETVRHGFAFLDELLAGGMVLEYGERHVAGAVHKYKCSNVPEWKLNELLASHVRKECNVCLYFRGDANSLFCFNLDNNHKFNNKVVIPEMALTVRLLRDILSGAGCEPLVIASGRGYHLWCRLDGAVDNGALYDFMLRAMARTLFGVHKEGLDHNKIKANFYPDPRSVNVVSLRLFGTEHTNNKAFSQILEPEGLLDEPDSWAAFEEHLRTNTIARDTFDTAYSRITGAL